MHYAMIFFMPSREIECTPVFSLSCTHSRNEVELTTVCDRILWGVTGGWLITGQKGRLLLLEMMLKWYISHILLARKWQKICLVMHSLAIEYVQGFEERCIQADVKWATKWQKKNALFTSSTLIRLDFGPWKTLHYFRHGNTTASFEKRDIQGMNKQ